MIRQSLIVSEEEKKKKNLLTRSANRFPVIFARTNRFKNSFICYGVANYQWHWLVFYCVIVWLFTVRMYMYCNPAFGCHIPINFIIIIKCTNQSGTALLAAWIIRYGWQLVDEDELTWNKVAWNWFNCLTRIITAILILNYRLVVFFYSKVCRHIWLKPRLCQINRVDHPKTFIECNHSFTQCNQIWLHWVKLGGRVVRIMDLRSTGRRFESWPPIVKCNPGKLLTHVPQSPSSIIWYQLTGGDALRLGR